MGGSSWKDKMKSLKIPSFSTMKEKVKKILSDAKEFKEFKGFYINLCEKALSEDFEKMKLFEQRNKDKMKVIEECYRLSENRGINITSISTSKGLGNHLYKYLLLVGLKKRYDVYNKTYKNYTELINDQFNVKTFMKSFSKKVQAAKKEKDLNELDKEFKTKAAAMETFLKDINEVIDEAYSSVIRIREHLQKYDQVDKKTLLKMHDQVVKKMTDARERLMQARSKQDKQFEEMQHDIHESLRTNKDINLVERFLSKNKGKVDSYGHIMIYSNKIGDHSGALELFDAEFTLEYLNEKAKDCWEPISSLEIQLKNLAKSEDFATYVSNQDALTHLEPEEFIAKAHMLMTKTTQRMQEFRDEIFVLANEAAKEIEGLRVHFKGDSKSGLNFEGLDTMTHNIVVPKGTVSGLRSKLKDTIPTSPQARGAKLVKGVKK